MDIKNIKSFSQFVTEDSNAVVFTFGRFNPPTVGHEKVFSQLKKQSRGAVYKIYPSQSQDPKKNPLKFKDKVKFMRKMFPKHARNIMSNSGMRTPFNVVQHLYDEGFTKITMVAGEDRLLEFDKLLNKYNGVKGKHGFYQFESGINVVSAGVRDPDAEGAKGMSASKLRAAAQAGDLKSFANGLPSGAPAEDLYNAVRKGMGLKEKFNHRQHVQLDTVSETREEYIKGNLFNIDDLIVVKETNEVGNIKFLGSNYVLVEFGDVKRRCWLDSIELVESNQGPYEIGTKELTASYSKMTPGESYDKMNAKQKAAHDKPRKNPESQHTKNFKKKFGEVKSFKQSLDEADVKAALKKKADKSGMPYGILKKVFDRGYAAWKSSHRPGTNPTQWGLARVNSFATKSSGTWGKADKDLAAKVRG